MREARVLLLLGYLFCFTHAFLLHPIPKVGSQSRLSETYFHPSRRTSALYSQLPEKIGDQAPRRNDRRPPLKNRILGAIATAYLLLVSKAINLRKRVSGLLPGERKARVTSSKSFLSSQRGKRPPPFAAFFSSLVSILGQPSFWYRAIALVMATLYLRGYMRYVQSLTLEVPYSSFLRVVQTAPERLSTLRITPSSYTFLLDGKNALTRPVDVDSSLLALFLKSGLDFYAPAASVNYIGLIWTVAYMGFLLHITNRMSQGPSDGGIGRGKGELSLDSSISFADVAGQDRAKYEVKEICDMLKAPERFLQLGARLPSGVLLCGPPGTGKTLLARVAAAEAGVPFYAVSASEFVEVFVGRGAARVRKLFKMAADNAPCILFIDELDSIGRSRRSMSMNSEQENTLNQLLTCMDGLETSNNGVIVMAATNRQELLDPALLRAGRFDRIVQCPLPDKAGRQAILAVHTRRLKLDPDVSLEKVARLTPGSGGADLAALANEAAIRAARRGGTSVNAEDFDNALSAFFSGRGVPLTGLAETIPSWLKGFTGEPSPSGAG